jgi:hypothetical protein
MSRAVDPDGIAGREDADRRGMVHLLRDLVGVGLMEAFERRPARQRLRAKVSGRLLRRLRH